VTLGATVRLNSKPRRRWRSIPGGVLLGHRIALLSAHRSGILSGIFRFAPFGATALGGYVPFVVVGGISFILTDVDGRLFILVSLFGLGFLRAARIRPCLVAGILRGPGRRLRRPAARLPGRIGAQDLVEEFMMQGVASAPAALAEQVTEVTEIPCASLLDRGGA